jgi:hypothetical protein
MKRLFAVTIAVGLAACSTAPPAPSTTIASAEVALTAAEKTATAYVTLPLCPAGATTGPNGKVCSQPVLVAKIKAADDVAYDAVLAARDGTGSVQQIIDAVSALSAATALIP